MSENTGYNGYSNYETWLCMLQIDNDPVLSRMFRQLGSYHPQEPYRLEGEIKSYIEESNPLSKTTNIYSDLLNTAISRIDFREITENILADQS